MDIVMVASSSKLTHMLIGGKNYKPGKNLRGSTIGSSTLSPVPHLFCGAR